MVYANSDAQVALKDSKVTPPSPNGYSRADIHMHTNLGDGWASPAKIVEEATRRGFPLIAITDHDHVEGAKRVQELIYQQNSSLQMITGVEVSTRQAIIERTVRPGGQELPTPRLPAGVYVAQCAWSWFVDPPRRIMRSLQNH